MIWFGISWYVTVWYGLVWHGISAGHILYLRPSISRLSTSARPPSHPRHIHHHQELHHHHIHHLHHLHHHHLHHPHLKVTGWVSAINNNKMCFCLQSFLYLKLTDIFPSRRALRSLDRKCFSILNFLQVFCSGGSFPSWILWSRSGFPQWRWISRCTLRWLLQIFDIFHRRAIQFHWSNPLLALLCNVHLRLERMG